MIESQYTQNIHKRLPDDVFAWKINDDYQGGVPDAFYRLINPPEKIKGSPLWVEYKFLKQLPKRDQTLVIPKLTELQKLWLRQAWNAGEKALVIVGVEQEIVGRTVAGFILDNPRDWESGITTGKAREMLKSYTQVVDSLVSVLKNE